MTTLYLKPAEGRLIRNPLTRQPIPAWGAGVPATPYWRQLRLDGDVVNTTAEAIEAAETKANQDAAAKAAEAKPSETAPAAKPRKPAADKE